MAGLPSVAHLLLVCHPPLAPGDAADPRTWLLSPAGRARIGPLAGRLRPYAPEVVVGSADPSGLETARLLAVALDCNMHTADDLHDRAGGEAAEVATQRFTRAVEMLAKGYRSSTLAVVSGPGVISGYLAARCGVDAEVTARTLDRPSFVAVDRDGHVVTELAARIP